MPSVHDISPADVQNELNKLAQALHTQIPAKTDTNLIVANWNIQRFDSLTRRLTAADHDSRKRGSLFFVIEHRELSSFIVDNSDEKTTKPPTIE